MTPGTSKSFMKKLLSIKKHWPAFLSAGLTILCLPPFNFALLTFVCLVPLLAYLRVCDPKEARHAGFLYGFVLFSTQMYFVVTLLERWTGSFWIGLIPYIITLFLAGWLHIIPTVLVRICWQRNFWWLIPIVWAGCEAIRDILPVVNFPWAILGHPFFAYPAFGQTAAFGTVHLVSAWCVIPSVLLVFWIWPKSAPSLGFKKVEIIETLTAPKAQLQFRAGLIFMGLMFASLLRYSQMPKTVTKVVTIGQPGIDLAYTKGAQREILARQSGMELMQQAITQNSELMVLPEGYALGGEKAPNNPFGSTPEIPVLLGATHLVGRSHRQAAFLWDGTDWSATDKIKLVPYGEYTPFRGIIPDGGLTSGFRDFDPGTELKTLNVKGVKVGPLICFEGLFPEMAAQHCRQGAQMLAVMSIDEWYMNTPAWNCLWQSSIWRSIESGLPLVRCVGLGQSLATDTRGRILTMVPLNKRMAARVELPVPAESDAFGWRIGFVWLCYATCIYLAIDGIIRKSRAKKPEVSK